MLIIYWVMLYIIILLYFYHINDISFKIIILLKINNNLSQIQQ